MKGFLILFFLFSLLFHGQIRVNLLVDDGQFGYTTKFQKKEKEKENTLLVTCSSPTLL